MEELEKLKLESEIKHIQAQTEKAIVEAAKTDADIKSSQRTLGYWLVELTKSSVAVVIGIGSVFAVFTGYQHTELKKERMEFNNEKLEKQMQETEQLLEATTKKKNEADNSLAETQIELVRLQSAVGELKRTLVADEKILGATPDTEVFQTSIKLATEIQDSISNIDTQLRSTNSITNDEVDNIRLTQLTENLFSQRSVNRQAAYDSMTREFRKDPDAVTALLIYAQKHMDNADGVYNTVATLKDLSRAVTQPRKDDINRFCDDAEKAGERTKNKCDSLRKWLETSR